ncbi:MAG TPA: amidohydrolase family protein [Steroidobacteraceae bacterium]|nr:amidohydrolase family protein [Steroidobacteraceae bacterium]
MLTRRSFVANASALLASCMHSARSLAREASTGTYAFRDAHWFDGERFRRGDFYSVAGTLTFERPQRVEMEFDLSRKYVVPPLGEAHNHNIESSPGIDEVIGNYVRDGIFYVKNPNTSLASRTALAHKVNAPSSIDVSFANGGITASGGHPIGIARRNLERGGSLEMWGEGAFYFVVDSEADLDRKWPLILEGKPDFIKTLLLYSEDYERRKADDAYLYWRGLNPSLLPAIVDLAHRAGLRVSTHVETAADFHHALIAGVDEINHMPGFRVERDDWATADPARFRISAADASLAAQRRTVVVTTLVSALERILEARAGEKMQAWRDLIVGNLRMLRDNSVRLAIGSDSYRQTSMPEGLGLARLGIFDNRSLLQMWCETTAATIFPARKIGRLREGYEASFLILDADPLQDLANLQKISRRFKQGAFLSS